MWQISPITNSSRLKSSARSTKFAKNMVISRFIGKISAKKKHKIFYMTNIRPESRSKLSSLSKIHMKRA